MATRPTRLTALGTSLTLLVLTRVPAASSPWTYITLAMGLAVLAMAVFVTVWPKRASPAMRPGVLVGSLAVLLTPTTADAWLGMAPDWFVALVVVVSLHVFFQDETMVAPTVRGQAMPGRGKRMIRYLPFAVASAVLLAVPWTYAWLLPSRIHAAYELQGALTPLAPLVVLATTLVLFGSVRTWIHQGPREDSTREGTSNLATGSGGVDI